MHRPPSQRKRSKRPFCSRQCHMATMNEELNPTRMTPEVREKLSNFRRGKTQEEIERTAAEKRAIREAEVEKRRRLKSSPDKFPGKDVPVPSSEIERMKEFGGNSYLRIRGVPAHRYIAEQKLGRSLLPGEVVHHIDGNRHNNAPENLWVFPSMSEHSKWHAEMKRIAAEGGDPYRVPSETASGNC